MADESADPRRARGWKRDPWQRFAGRFWDGERWTEHVVTAERIRAVDPIPPEMQRAMPAQRRHVAAVTAEDEPTQVDPGPTAGAANVLPRRLWRGFRSWPIWTQCVLGTFLALLVLGVAVGGEDKPSPSSVVGTSSTAVPAISTDATEPTPAAAAATTILPTTVPPTTLAPTALPTTTLPPTTVTTSAPVTTRVTVATTVAPVPPTTSAQVVQQGVTRAPSVRRAGPAARPTPASP